jgi:hypothetical protein
MENKTVANICYGMFNPMNPGAEVLMGLKTAWPSMHYMMFFPLARYNRLEAGFLDTGRFSSEPEKFGLSGKPPVIKEISACNKLFICKIGNLYKLLAGNPPIHFLHSYLNVESTY